MIVHLIDGTYELYRQHFGQAVRHSSPPPLAATRGVVTSTLQLLVGGATHVTVAVDHVIESFRNQMYEGYKTSDGMEAEILDQIPLMEDALRALGIPVWPMVKYEADDGLAAGALIASLDDRVDQVQMITPDKDLGQCVVGNRIVQYDRRNDLIVNETAIIEKFGVGPASIADWLGLVGDTADGFPGLPGWGAKSATSVLAKYLHIGEIPDDEAQWVTDGVAVRGAAKLAATLRDQRPMAELFKQVATVVTDVSDDVPLGSVDDWKWRGPTKDLGTIAKQLNMTDLVERTERAMVGRRS
ncbi:MAG: 5'-3' exonuclease H3TH domain-containing protein [Actinomycetota bacterium]